MVKALHSMDNLSTHMELPPELRVALAPADDLGPPPPSVAANQAVPLPAADGADEAAIASAVAAALRAPLAFPPLSQAVVPDDQFAIAVDESVPMVASVVLGAIDSAIDAGVDPDAIRVVTADAMLATQLRDEIAQHPAQGAVVEFHDPADETAHCLVGQMHDGQPLRIDRTLYESEVVLPIGCARLADTAAASVFDSLYPRFSDAESIGRRLRPKHRASHKHQSAAQQRNDEAGWLLGVPMVVQVVPGGNGSVAEIVAGDPLAVARHAQWRCRQRWSLVAQRRASLVIVEISGGLLEQGWENVGRALAVADRLVEDGGAVAICSDLEAPPGQSLARLNGASDWQKVQRQTAHEEFDDSWTAWQLAGALQRGPVYFFSRLEDETVEPLGLAPVANLDELARLAGRHESCIILGDAQHVAATVAGEA